jgi:hypothetical protein
MKPIAERASAYLARMPVSISGQGGDRAAFSAAVALVKGFALSEQEAYPHMSRWNADCLPPWSESVLRQKLRSAATSGVCAPGYLLREDDPPPTARTAPDFESEGEKKARQRQAWPELHALTHEDIRTIAKLRGIFPDAVDLAHRHGFLKATTVQGQRCFAVVEGTFA